MRAIFLDRDGVVNVYRSDYVLTEEDFEYYPWTEEALRLLGTTGLPIVVVTNQSAIGRGTTTHEIVTTLHDRLRSDAHHWGVALTVEVCPHAPSESCPCRKPKTGLFERARDRLQLMLPGSYLVGDAPSDIEVGRKLGLITIRVTTGRGAEPGSRAHHEVEHLLDAARQIRLLEDTRDS